MITITDREALALPGSPTSRFEGGDHGADISLFWVRTPPGAGPDFHWHPYTETWVVLAGEVQVDADDEHLVARPGDHVTVTAGTVHRFRNSGTATLEMICIHASDRIIQEFVDPPSAG